MGLYTMFENDDHGHLLELNETHFKWYCVTRHEYIVLRKEVQDINIFAPLVGEFHIHFCIVSFTNRLRG